MQSVLRKDNITIQTPGSMMQKRNKTTEPIEFGGSDSKESSAGLSGDIQQVTGADKLNPVQIPM
ncbi:MAG: hypothetical protein AB8G99_04950 [Planctomycetaceae bacterium]